MAEKERYKEIFKLPENLYFETLPVIIKSGRLLKDKKNSSIVVKLLMQNIEKKNITYMDIDILEYDKNRKYIDKKHFSMSRPNIVNNQEFSLDIPVILKTDIFEMFTVRINEVGFSDSSSWINAGKKVRYKILKKPVDIKTKLKSKEYINLFNRESEIFARYLPNIQLDLWQCFCGAINRKNSLNCSMCGKDIKFLMEKFEQAEAFQKKNMEASEEEEKNQNFEKNQSENLLDEVESEINADLEKTEETKEETEEKAESLIDTKEIESLLDEVESEINTDLEKTEKIKEETEEKTESLIDTKEIESLLDEVESEINADLEKTEEIKEETEEKAESLIDTKEIESLLDEVESEINTDLEKTEKIKEETEEKAESLIDTKEIESLLDEVESEINTDLEKTEEIKEETEEKTESLEGKNEIENLLNEVESEVLKDTHSEDFKITDVLSGIEDEIEIENDRENKIEEEIKLNQNSSITDVLSGIEDEIENEEKLSQELDIDSRSYIEKMADEIESSLLPENIKEKDNFEKKEAEDDLNLKSSDIKDGESSFSAENQEKIPEITDREKIFDFKSDFEDRIREFPDRDETLKDSEDGQDKSFSDSFGDEEFNETEIKDEKEMEENEVLNELFSTKPENKEKKLKDLQKYMQENVKEEEKPEKKKKGRKFKKSKQAKKVKKEGKKSILSPLIAALTCMLFIYSAYNLHAKEGSLRELKIENAKIMQQVKLKEENEMAQDDFRAKSLQFAKNVLSDMNIKMSFVNTGIQDMKKDKNSWKKYYTDKKAEEFKKSYDENINFYKSVKGEFSDKIQGMKSLDEIVLSYTKFNDLCMAKPTQYSSYENQYREISADLSGKIDKFIEETEKNQN